jgi:hypothetical protein
MKCGNAVCVTPFCGKSEFLPTCTERLHARAMGFGCRNILSGSMSIPRSDEVYDENSDIRKKNIKVAELRELK